MSKRHKVIVADFITDSLAPERSVLGDIADVVALNATDEKEMVGKVEDAGALMGHRQPPLRVLLRRGPHGDAY